MTSIQLQLDSKQAEVNDSNNRSDDFTVKVQRPIPLPSKEDYVYECALISAKIYNVIPNISAALNNNTLEVKRNDADSYTALTLPDGRYDYTDINERLYYELFQRGWYGGSSDSPQFAVKLQVAPSTNQFVWTFADPADTGEVGATKYSIRMPGDINVNLGFAAGAVVSQGDTLAVRSSTTTPNISFDGSQYSIFCDIISNGFSNGVNRNIIAEYTPDKRSGALLQIRPSERVYLPVNRQQIEQIRVYIRDAAGRRVDLRGERTVINLHVRQRRV